MLGSWLRIRYSLEVMEWGNNSSIVHSPSIDWLNDWAIRVLRVSFKVGIFLKGWRTVQIFKKSAIRILAIKPTRCTNFSNLFWNKTPHVSDSSSLHHQEFFTVHTAMVHTIQVWSYRFSDSFFASSQQTCVTYTIDACKVKNSWWWTEELSETCRVLFQNKFQKFVHLVGFIIRIHQDARSPERQICNTNI